MLMTSTTVDQHHRPVLPVVNLFLAAGAAVLGLVALTSDDVAAPAAASSVSRLPARSEPALPVPGYAVLIVDEECGVHVRGNLAC
jgi:hypothetical protein